MLTETSFRPNLERMYVITTQGPEFPTGEKVVYHSQLTEFPPEWNYVARRTCGITAASMAISLARPEITPVEVLLTASQLHQVPSDQKNFWLKTTWQDHEVFIPKGQQPPADLPETFTLTDQPPPTNTGDRYAPVFSIDRGYDHRGSEALFAKFGQTAKKIGDQDRPVTTAEITELTKSGYVFLFSVKNSVTPWLAGYNFTGPLSHIVLLTDIVEMDGQLWYNLLDPYSPTGKKVQIIRPAASFHEVEFSGFGTAVKAGPVDDKL